MRRVSRWAAWAASLFLSACISSDRDLSQTYDPVSPVRPGTYRIGDKAPFKLSVRDGVYFINEGREGSSKDKYRFFKVPETDDVLIVQWVHYNDSSSEAAAYYYSFASIDDKGVVMIFDMQAADNWRLPDDLKSLTETDGDLFIKIKQGFNTDQVLRTIAKLKIERDPATRRLTVTPVD